MKIIYEIIPKSHDEYCDVIDAISDWLDRNNIIHTKTEINETRPPMRDPIKKRR